MIQPITAEQMQQSYLSALYNMGCVVFTNAAQPTIKQQAIAFAEDRGIPLNDFFGTTRTWDVAHPRQEFWASLRPEHSFPVIGRHFNRDHSTVQHGVEAYQRRRAAQ